MPTPLNSAFLQIGRRAETNTPENLVRTFVDDGVLFTQLSSKDHQIMFGRRGTGKTHVLFYLRESALRAGEPAVYVDIRKIGSTSGLYADPRESVSTRGTTLLVDVLLAIHDQLMDLILTAPFSGDDEFARACGLADDLSKAATTVRVVGEHEREATLGEGETADRSVSGQIAMKATGPEASTGVSRGTRTEAAAQVRMLDKGVIEYHLVFGGIADTLRKLAAVLPGRRAWILLDEWSVVPLDLQPLLADMLKRCIFPVDGVTVKIAAIKDRSSFQAPSTVGGYVGIELGADAFADVDLDDFMVFGNDAERAKRFFMELLYRHVVAVLEEVGGTGAPRTSEELLREGFTQITAFEELVRAAEGVPRDAINIVALSARQAGNDRISVPHVRSAARNWYLRDKAPAVAAREEANELLNWIIDRVIGDRKARAFLLRQGASGSSRLIDDLYDARVLHLIKRGISSPEQAGARYNVYSLDYGSYVDLINTAKAPNGLLPAGDADDGSFVDVPPDDYRAIRRAILDLDEFEESRSPAAASRS